MGDDKIQIRLIAGIIPKIESFRLDDDYQNWHRLRKHRLILYTYRYNFARIKKSLVFYKNVHHDDPVKFWVEGKVRRNFQRRITTNLLNYLAAIASIIDITREVVKENLKIPEHISIYNRYKDELASHNKSSRFVRDLRNYTLHRSLLNVIVFFHSEWINDELHQTGFPYLNRSELLQWSKWSPEAKAYLTKLDGEKVNLDEVIFSYHDRFMFLQDLLWCMILVENRDSLQRLLEKMERIEHEKETKGIEIALPFSPYLMRYLSWILQKTDKTSVGKS